MKIYSTLCMLLVAASLLMSCSKDPVTTIFPLNLTPAEQQQAVAGNAFSFALFDNVVSGQAGKNVMVSPFSVGIAVGMASNGAYGATLDGIRSTLKVNGFAASDVNSYYKKLITGLPKLDPLATVRIANSIWYKNELHPLDSFLQTNKDSYKATVSAVNFGDPATLGQINGWVSSNTNGKIPKILDEIGPHDVMYLINALYFKSNWKYKFDKNKTKADTFYTPNDKVVADFMTASNVYMQTFSDNDAALFELPYGNDLYSMVIILPGANKTTTDLLGTLDSTHWNKWMSKMTGVTHDVKMPKFACSFSSTLNGALSTMGMGLAFSDNADFSKVAGVPGIKITQVVHKTFIEVNEDGTEATAATSIGFGTTAAPLQTLTINHPFVYVIRERQSGLILFIGEMNNPKITDGTL